MSIEQFSLNKSGFTNEIKSQNQKDNYNYFEIGWVNYNDLKIDWVNYDDLEKTISSNKDELLSKSNKELKDFFKNDYVDINKKLLLKSQLYIWKYIDVGDLQYELNRQLWISLKINWDFWQDTYEALIEFQKKKWLKADWLCWIKTQKKLFETNIIITKKNNETIKSKNKIAKNTGKEEKWPKKIPTKEKFLDFISKISNRKELAHTKKCWTNVWKFLEKAWIPWIPNIWRDWHKWGEILENNPYFEQVEITDPSQAKPWTILVYDKWHWEWPRKKYWHVEVCVPWEWDNCKYYFWMLASNPWWSIKNWNTGFKWAYIYTWPKNT